MGKHVIDLRPECKLVQQICESDGAFGVSTVSAGLLDELNDNYVQEHFSTILRDEYDRGYKDGCDVTETQAHDDAFKQGVEYGKTQEQDRIWNCIKKIVLNHEDGGITISELNKIFGCYTIQYVFKNYTLQQIIEKLEAYKEKQKADDTIKVGDIITDGKINYLVIDITDKSYITLQGTDFEPAFIGRDYIKSYHNLRDSKDVQKIAEEINKAAIRWNVVAE